MRVKPLTDVESRLGLDGLSDSISRDFSSCSFSFLSSEDIRKIAAVDVTQPDVFDALSGVLPNGLHDLHMGGWRDQEDTTCPTCKLSLRQGCVGHYGRVELTECVYHPLLLADLMKLLKQHCRSCGSLRMHTTEKKTLITKFRFLARGQLPPTRVLKH